MRCDFYSLAIAIRRIRYMQIQVDGVVQLSPAGQCVFYLCHDILETNADRAISTGVSFDADGSNWQHHIILFTARIEINSSHSSGMYDLTAHWYSRVQTTVCTSLAFKRIDNIIKVVN